MDRTSRATLVALLVIVAPLAAQSPPRSGEQLQVHPEARQAISKIKSPFCPGLMLEVCTSQGGAMLRDSIQAMAVRGLRSDSIAEVVFATYGEEWRAEPLREGAGLWAWLLPPIGLLVGVGAVTAVLARRRVRDDSPSTVGELSEADEARVRAAIEDMDALERPEW